MDEEAALHPYRLVHSPLQKQSLVFFACFHVIDSTQRRKSGQTTELARASLGEKKVKKKVKQKFSDLKLSTHPTNAAVVQKTRYKFYLTSDVGSGGRGSEKKLINGTHLVVISIYPVLLLSQLGRDGVFLGTNHMVSSNYLDSQSKESNPMNNRSTCSSPKEEGKPLWLVPVLSLKRNPRPN